MGRGVVKGHAGFTLVEAMIGMAIAVILLSVALPSYTAYRERVDFGMAEADLVKITIDMERYYAGAGQYPPDLATIGANKVDPWGNPYQYLNMALVEGNGSKRKDHNLVPLNTDYDLYSMGPDGRSVAPLTAMDSRDDIIRANNGQYVGPAADY